MCSPARASLGGSSYVILSALGTSNTQVDAIFSFSSRDRDHGGPEGMEPDGVIEVCII